MQKHNWIKAGLIGACVYPILNGIFLLAATCVYFGSHEGCLLVGWMYLHLFPGEAIARIISPMDSTVAFFSASIAADLVLGFLIGAVTSVVMRSLRNR